MLSFLTRLFASALLSGLAATCGCASATWTHSPGIAVGAPVMQPGVTVIFVESPRDIFSIAGLPEVSDYFNAQGIHSLYYDPWLDQFDAQGLADLIRHVKRDPTQQVLLVGWSLGAAMSLDAIDVLAAEGIGVETCVILDCFNLNFHRGRNLHPPNLRRLVVARSQAFAFPAGLVNADTRVIETLNHFAVPKHPTTINLLFSEVALLSQPHSPQ